MTLSSHTSAQDGDLVTPTYLNNKFGPLVDALHGWESGSVQTNIISLQTGLWSFGTDSHTLPVSEFGSNKTVTMLIYAGPNIDPSQDWNTFAILNNNSTGDKLVFSVERNNSANTVYDVNFRNCNVEFGSYQLSADSGTILVVKSGDTINPHKVAFNVYQPSSQTSVAWSLRHTGEVLQYTKGGSAGYSYGIYNSTNGDTCPVFAISQSGASVQWGPGSSTTPDTWLGRSAGSTLRLGADALQFGGARLESVKTIAGLGNQSTVSDTEWSVTVGLSVATLNIRSGNTTYYFAASGTTDQ